MEYHEVRVPEMGWTYSLNAMDIFPKIRWSVLPKECITAKRKSWASIPVQYHHNRSVLSEYIQLPL